MIPGLSPAIADKAEQVKLSDYGVFNQQYALTEVPIWRAGDTYNGVTTVEILNDDYDRFLTSFDDLTQGRMPFNALAPLVNIQSNIDPSRAPEGCAAVYLYSFAPFEIEGGWDANKCHVADALFDWFASFTTNIDQSKVIGRIVESPKDHHNHSRNMMNGDIMGCAMGYGQIMGGRPFPEVADYTVPGISNLWLTGPTQHPGGTVTLGGRATAMKILDDLQHPLSDVFTAY